MKKIDKLIITSFLGPFALTFLVVDFILLNINMLKYFDDIIGKDLGFDVVATLFFYFAVFNTPIALPLAVLLSSLITFGNLGEHFELTAIKSLGVSLTRALLPISFIVVFITGFAFVANNYLVPKAALEAFSLMYDIKQKKPSLDLREGSFYGGIPDVSIKVNRKAPDGITLEGVVIYDHRNRSGNREVTVADSGRMFTILGNNYLKLELFRGYNYSEGGSMERDMMGGQTTSKDTFSKTHFDKTYVVFDLSSFNLGSTDKKWFKGNRIMRNVSELDSDMDSVETEMNLIRLSIFENATSGTSALANSFSIKLPQDLEKVKRKPDTLQTASALEVQHRRNYTNDSLQEGAAAKRKLGNRIKSIARIDSTWARPVSNRDSLFNNKPTKSEVSNALIIVRGIKSQLMNFTENLKSQRYEFNVFHIQWHKILANSAACFIMFLIGAPLGSIIKRGGLGVPVLTSIIFFILFYVMSLMGEKWAKQEAISVPVGIWTANAILLIIGLIFLRQARVDARLFESDFYQVLADKVRSRFSKKQPA
jgi:lipopolysaccharide export system permease protein